MIETAESTAAVAWMPFAFRQICGVLLSAPAPLIGDVLRVTSAGLSQRYFVSAVSELTVPDA